MLNFVQCERATLWSLFPHPQLQWSLHLCLLDLLCRALKLGSSTLTTTHGFQSSRASNLGHRRDQLVLSAYFSCSSGSSRKATPSGRRSEGGAGAVGRTTQQVGQGQFKGRFWARSESKQAQAEQATGYTGQMAKLGPKQPKQLAEGIAAGQRGNQAPCAAGASSRGRTQTRIEKESVLTMELHGGGILPMMYDRAHAWKESREKEKDCRKSSTNTCRSPEVGHLPHGARSGIGVVVLQMGPG